MQVDNERYQLYPKEAERVSYPDIQIWGKPIVYDTPAEAVRGLSTLDKKERRIRLIRIATNEQLHMMLDRRRELCRPDASLYLEISASCPLYYAPWDDCEHNADVELVNALPRRGSNKSLLEAMSPTSLRQMVVGRVKRERKKIVGRNGFICPLVVRACADIVGGAEFGRHMGATTDDDGSEDDVNGVEIDT